MVHVNNLLLLQDFLELSKFPCEESDPYSWRDEHSQMTSTIAQHGFHFTAKTVSTVVSNLATNRMKDLSWEMFSCTTDMKTSSKLLRWGDEVSRALHFGCGLETNPHESKALLERYVHLPSRL